ncbi:syntaxin-2 isoform X2 [Babesia ovis]|uniref:Syntaxin-2 isoform X2 n=1 Tax=Babesia ovis TaxID=5869 RepID=A0A9W5WUU6_BABOV|nr:syntaxin-2 isoform X2 [Babesia ovis]
MTFEGESEWLLEVESLSSEAKSTRNTDGNYHGNSNPLMTSVSTGFSDGDNTPDSLATLDGKKSMQQYIEEISQLNGAIDEFSKIIQTLALFKYYIRNRKGNTNLDELHRRFNSFSVKCANKVRIIQQHVAAVNRDNHYAMAHREAMNYSYSDLRARFNMQDASVNRLKTLMETYQSVIKEYTAAAKSIEEAGNAGATSPFVSETIGEQNAQLSAEATLIDELKSKSKDIMTLEKNARDLNQLFAELNTTIKKRGENIYNLEQQILLSAEQIEKGKEDMTLALKARGGQGLYWMCIFIAAATCLLVIPSHIKSAVFRTHQVLNWVMARGKIPQDCNKRLLALEEQCKGFFERHTNLPDNVKQAAKHANADYTEWYEVIREITDKLKATEDGEKVNFIGQYAYEPLYDADKILKAFHKNNLHIVSYFQLLQQQVAYNVPSIRKSIDMNKKELADYKNRKTICARKLKTAEAELGTRLKFYNIDIEQCPFDTEFTICLKEKLIHEIRAKNVEVTIENYKRTMQLAKNISSELVHVFGAYVKLHDMDNLYSRDTMMKTITQAAEHGMDVVQSDTSLSGAADTTSEPGTDGTNADGIMNVINHNDYIVTDNEWKRVIFETNLGNTSFRQLFLGELLELRTFVKVRIDELQNSPDTANYVFTCAEDNVNSLVQQPLSKYEKYMDILNEAINLMSGTVSMRSLSLLKNESELDKCAQVELDIFNRCCNAVTEQRTLMKRIEAAEETLRKLNGEMEAVRKTIRETKAKLEKTAGDVMGETVTLFGEIDEI